MTGDHLKYKYSMLFIEKVLVFQNTSNIADKFKTLKSFSQKEGHLIFAWKWTN